MFSFKEYIVERRANPEQLAHRLSKRYGKRTSFGKWEKVVKGGHIPLTSFDGRKVRALADREWSVRKRLGTTEYNSMKQPKRMKISDLKATQPFVRTNDLDKLRSKIHDKHPTHVSIVTYKGVHYINDGHHSVMAAKLRGDKYIDVKHIDLDQFSKNKR